MLQRTAAVLDEVHQLKASDAWQRVVAAGLPNYVVCTVVCVTVYIVACTVVRTSVYAHWLKGGAYPLLGCIPV